MLKDYQKWTGFVHKFLLVTSLAPSGLLWSQQIRTKNLPPPKKGHHSSQSIIKNILKNLLQKETKKELSIAVPQKTCAYIHLTAKCKTIHILDSYVHTYKTKQENNKLNLFLHKKIIKSADCVHTKAYGTKLSSTKTGWVFLSNTRRLSEVIGDMWDKMAVKPVIHHTIQQPGITSEGQVAAAAHSVFSQCRSDVTSDTQTDAWL